MSGSVVTIYNTSEGDINVSTPVGKFLFPAKGSLDLAQDRADKVAYHGAIYFSIGELTTDPGVELEPDDSADADDSGSNDADDNKDDGTTSTAAKTVKKRRR